MLFPYTSFPASSFSNWLKIRPQNTHYCQSRMKQSTIYCNQIFLGILTFSKPRSKFCVLRESLFQNLPNTISSVLLKFHDLDSELKIQKVIHFHCFRRFVKYRSQPDQRLFERLHQVQLLERRRRRKSRSRGQQTWHVDAGIYILLMCIITLKCLISGLIKS